MNATVLVTGGAGFIGSHTIDLLLKRGYRVRVLDALRPPVHVAGQWPGYLPADVERVLGDVRDRTTLRQALSGVEVVFHLAAYQDYLTDFSTFFDVNATGTALLYELIVSEHLPVSKVVVASSQAVYGEGKYLCPDDGVQYPPARLERQLRAGRWELRCPVCAGPLAHVPTGEEVVYPHSPYAMSKYAQEMIATRLGRRYAIPSVALRYSITQGPRQSFRNAYSGICRIFVSRLLAGRQPLLYEDGGQLRDYVDVRDVARANLLAMTDSRADYQAFNVGGGQGVSVRGYASLVGEVLDTAVHPAIPGEYRLGDTRHIVSDIARLRALGWEPRTPLHQTIADYVDWASSQPDLRDYSSGAARVMKEQGAVRRTQTDR